MPKNEYDDTTRSWLKEVGVPSYEGATSIRQPSGFMPYTEAGIPGLIVRDMPYLTDSNARGFVLSSNLIADEN